MQGSLLKTRWVPAHGSESEPPLEIEAFIPHTIEAANWDVPFGVAQDITQAQAALSQLQSQTDLFPLSSMLLREEGIASSRIEGLFLSTRRILESQFAPSAVNDRTADQVLANIETLEEVLESASRELDVSDIRRWHRRLMSPEGERVLPGGWRVTQNWIGGDAWTPRNAEFIPPPPDLVPDLVEDLVTFCNRRDAPPVVQAAIAHAQFETIHPFVDGNGRVGRALILWVLKRRGSIEKVPPTISSVFAVEREAYVSGLTAYRFGDLNEWLSRFAQTVTTAATVTANLATALDEMKERWRKALGPTRSDSVALAIVRGMQDHPIIDPPTVTDRYGVSHAAARDALLRLADAGILTERPLRKAKRGRPARTFAATELIDLLDRTPIR